jgi:hypothetical protein
MFWIVTGIILIAGPSRPMLETEVVEHGLAEHDLATALLIASGETEPAGVTRSAELLVETVRRLALLTQRQNQAPDQLSADLLAVMHRDLLQSYTSGAYDLRKTWSRGEYNCLTATSLFLLVAKELGLPAGAYATNGRIQAVVFTPSGPVFVETAAPGSNPSDTWFRPLESSLGAATGARGLRDPGAEQEPAAEGEWLTSFEIDAPTLVGLHFWNRAVMAAAAGRATQALRFSDAFASLVSDTIRAKTIGLRLLEVEGVLGRQMRGRGWQTATATVTTLLEVTGEPPALLQLRDIRARLWAVAMSNATGQQRCAIATAAQRADPDHPIGRVLQEKASSSGCSAQTRAR